MEKGVRNREQLGGKNMKFSTKAKYRMPTTLVDFLLERVFAPNQPQQQQMKRVTGPRSPVRPGGSGACNGKPRVAGIPATQFNVGTHLAMEVEAVSGNGEIKKDEGVSRHWG